MRPTLQVLTLATLLTGIGTVAIAQQAPGTPRGAGNPPAAGRAVAPRAGGGVTAILNARRTLELTPRQVAQLDSIERGLHAERQRVTAAMRPALDSMRQRVRTEGPPRDPAQRQQLQQQAEQRRAAMRPQMEQLRMRDSSATAAAERLLNDTQRGKWREMQAERRGFARGMRAGRGGARGPQARGQRPGPRPDQRQGLRQGPRPEQRRPMPEGQGRRP